VGSLVFHQRTYRERIKAIPKMDFIDQHFNLFVRFSENIRADCITFLNLPQLAFDDEVLSMKMTEEML
jgi:hypothetical protein